MDVYEEIVRLRRQGRRGAVATIVSVQGSVPSFRTAKMLVRDDGSIAGTIGGGCVEAEVWQAAKEVMEQEKPRTLKFNLNHDPKLDTGLVCGGTLEIFVEPVLPLALLYLFGAGHVAQNIYKIANIAGFQVCVVDDRTSYASRERFPEADEVVALDQVRGRSQAGQAMRLPDVLFVSGHVHTERTSNVSRAVPGAVINDVNIRGQKAGLENATQGSSNAYRLVFCRQHDAEPFHS